tara:strand:- start:104 stop:811 length:708 start_codon:yes stop_codon:yes gene_type:complete
MNLFFCPEVLQQKFYLNDIESNHCKNVLRKKINDIIDIFDGKGTFHKVQITSIIRNKVKFKIIKTSKEINKKYYLHIAISPLKKVSRFENFIEKSTEIGIDQITPLFCINSEKHNINYERLNNIIISALKQSKRATIPKLNNAEKFEDFIKKNFKSKKYIATCNTNFKKELLSKTIRKSKNIIILIGPEGGFTNIEIELASNNNFNFVSLGRNTLRTETSGIVACQTVKIINDEN